ncbi:MAG: DUF3078 domain-containing protein [Marinilabiliaceae bacterium]|jgi:hypothetical protein|nr:DUF3078 domain-containing protein [Marinilabiliaceae bacterium]
MKGIKGILLVFVIVLFGLLLPGSLCAQVNDTLVSHQPRKDTVNPALLDSIAKMSVKNITFSDKQAIEYIESWYNNKRIWNKPDDPLRRAMARFLFEARNEQFYVSEWYIDSLNWESIKIPASSFYLWDTLKIMLPAEPVVSDSLLIEPDTIIIGDTPDSTKVFFRNDTIRPAPGDSIILVISDTLREVIGDREEFPFSYYNYPMVGDSIQAAMNVLRNYTLTKDSTRVVLIGAGNTIPVWLSNGPNNMVRLRLRNEWDEELSVWIGSPSRDSISVIVESGVRFRRPNKETRIAEARIDMQTVDKSTLADPRAIDFKPQYWKFFSEASFLFNQALLANWSKGGESNISTLLDLTGTANYTNKDKKMTWNTIGRFKYGIQGLQTSNKFDLRKNIDLIDISSKFNNKAFGKFDFSSSMIFKTQLARGYNYPNDSVIVSKFFNPATLTLGFGLEYHPNKNTSVNFAPLSYKGTFVTDTVLIDQTKHGLTIDQRSKHEPGMSAQVDHKMELWERVTVVNKVRLFTNYINNPLNIDIDWEMIATAKLNYFTDIRLNTQIIYDDDTLIPVFDKENQPVLGSDGKQKKEPRVQFKEAIGLSIIFRF